MKKLLPALSAALVLALPGLALADTGVPTPNPSTGSTGLPTVANGLGSLAAFAHDLALFFFSLTGLVFVIVVLFNSWRLMTSAHDPQKRVLALQGYGYAFLAGIAAFGSGWLAALTGALATKLQNGG
jgi:hypothetical protein